MKKWDKVGGLTLPTFKVHCKAIIVKNYGKEISIAIPVKEKEYCFGECLWGNSMEKEHCFQQVVLEQLTAIRDKKNCNPYLKYKQKIT